MRATFYRLRYWLLRIGVTYFLHRASHDAAPKLFRPVLFSEKIQWRKLFGSDARYKIVSDKAAVRSHVAQQGYEHLLIPILWSGNSIADIPFDRLPFPLVLKSTHASGQVLVLRDRSSLDLEAIDRRTREWLSACYGTLMIEPGYVGIPRRLIVEPLLVSANGEAPMEYKIFVFNGRAEIIMAIFVDAGKIRHAAFYGRDWKKLDWSVRGQPVAGASSPPTRLSDMLQIAEVLAADFDHLRVDLYLCNGQIFFSELTLYSWSGLRGVFPVEADRRLGAFWHLRTPARRGIKAILTSHWGALEPLIPPMVKASYAATLLVSETHRRDTAELH